MSLRPRLAIVLAACTVAALTGCSLAPYRVDGSSGAESEAQAAGVKMLPRLKPRAIGICYSPAFNEPAEVEAEAVYRCDGGRVVQKDEDFFWNGCSLSQPNRISYVCYPPDKAKRLDGGSTTTN